MVEHNTIQWLVRLFKWIIVLGTLDTPWLCLKHPGNFLVNTPVTVSNLVIVIGRL